MTRNLEHIPKATSVLIYGYSIHKEEDRRFWANVAAIELARELDEECKVLLVTQTAEQRREIQRVREFLEMEDDPRLVEMDVPDLESLTYLKFDTSTQRNFDSMKPRYDRTSNSNVFLVINTDMPDAHCYKIANMLIDCFVIFVKTETSLHLECAVDLIYMVKDGVAHLHKNRFGVSWSDYELGSYRYIYLAKQKNEWSETRFATRSEAVQAARENGETVVTTARLIPITTNTVCPLDANEVIEDMAERLRDLTGDSEEWYDKVAKHEEDLQRELDRFLAEWMEDNDCTPEGEMIVEIQKHE